MEDGGTGEEKSGVKGQSLTVINKIKQNHVSERLTDYLQGH